MTETNAGRWEIENLNPAQVLAHLPEMDKLMVILSENGVTHERIGTVGIVQEKDGQIILSGDSHSATIFLKNLHNVILDTTSVMKDKTYPRLDFCDAENNALVSVVGWSGVDAFLKPLGDLQRKALTEKEGEPRSKAELADDDACLAPFQVAQVAGQAVEICMQTATTRQCWTGVIKDLKPAMGFMNIMTPDFHLHLKGDTVTSWEIDANVHYAVGENGQRTGLSLKEIS